MIKKILEFIKGKFKREEEEIINLPYEYGIIQFNEEAEGEEGNEFKEIILYEGEEKKVYPYSKALLNALIKVKKIPFKDMTLEERKLPIYLKIEPGVIEYQE